MIMGKRERRKIDYRSNSPFSMITVSEICVSAAFGDKCPVDNLEAKRKEVAKCYQLLVIGIFMNANASLNY